MKQFGRLSGLQIQPHMSCDILMNSSITPTAISYFPVLPKGKTVQYLGVEIGIGDTTVENWSKRLAKLQSRLGIAARCATNLRDRIRLINARFLPSIMFTGCSVD